jgi:hypothetical protein
VTQISIFRTSFIWVETVPSILEGKTAGQPFAFLGQTGDYAQAFDQCQSGTPGVGGLKLPWDGPRGNRYWQYYLEKHAGDMTGAQAWKKLVPFQLDLPCKITSKDPELTFALDAFYAPQGIAVVARATYRGAAKTPLEVAKLALAGRYDYRFEIDGKDGLSLDRAAETALMLARRQGFGEKTEGVGGDNQPFSVTTVLVGENAVPLAQGSDEHFLLEAVTSWDRYLKPADLAQRPLAGAQLPIKGTDAENIMYARKHGRAIWMPRIFAGNSNTATLACWHRNVMQASRQTLSLGEFVSWAAAQANIHPAVRERAQRAVALLQLSADGAAATGKKTTYRSASVVEQIKDANWTKAMAAIKGLPNN